MFKRSIFLALFIFPIYSNAGGSVGVEDIENLLKQKPQIKEFIDKNFDISSGFAEVRFSSNFVHLGGARMGPYEVIVVPKGQKMPPNEEDIQVLITICTAHKFLDAKGKVISEKTDDIFVASNVRETVTQVLIREWKDDKMPNCPETE